MAAKSEPWILGISASPHNGAACLLKGDEIVVAIQEERLNRRKRAGIYAAHPSLAVDYCLDYAGIKPKDLDLVAYAVTGRARSRQQDITLNPVLRVAEHGTPTLRIPHHLGHAVGAFATSGFREAAVLVVDGAGSPYTDFTDDERRACRHEVEDGFETVSLYAAAGTSFRTLEKHLVARGAWVGTPGEGMLKFGSLGGMYSAVAAQIFGDVMEAGKVMGLAPYGEADIPAREFFDITRGQFVFHDRVRERFRHNERWPLRQTEYRNLARSTQEALEEAVLYLVEHLHRLHPSENLCYAGGVALNSVANERIIGESAFNNIYIMAAAEDSGPAVGAAYYGLWNLTKSNTRRRLIHDAVGREYSAGEVARAIEKTPGTRLVDSKDVISDTVGLLREGKIVGWFQGRSELGPRALGQRSILCDPRRPDGKEVLNSRVKHREAFRPFAPVVLLEEVDKWFKTDGKDPHSPFMLRVCEFRDDKKELVPAVVHVDGTGRLQTVTREANGPLYELTRKFFEETGVPVVLNTSFNVMGEPIVETPADALATFMSTGLDYCVLHDKLVAKRGRILFEPDELHWKRRLRAAIDEAVREALARKTSELAGQRQPAPPPRPLEAYAGTFDNPQMGVLAVAREGDRLRASVRGGSLLSAAPREGLFEGPLRHYCGDAFEIVEGPFKSYKLFFIPDAAGNFEWVVAHSTTALPDDALAREYVFSRRPDESPEARTLFGRLTGRYAAGERELSVSQGGGGELLLRVPGEAALELSPRGVARFTLKDAPGYHVAFELDAGGAAVAVVVTEPNGATVLHRDGPERP